MFFRISNTITCFEDYIHKILTKKLDIFVTVYWDNILIYIKNRVWGHVKAV